MWEIIGKLKLNIEDEYKTKCEVTVRGETVMKCLANMYKVTKILTAYSVRWKYGSLKNV